MPATPTVSVCAFSISVRPPPDPRAVATTFGRPGSVSSIEPRGRCSASQPATKWAISSSPGAPGINAGLTDSIAKALELLGQLGSQRLGIFAHRRGAGDPTLGA